MRPILGNYFSLGLLGTVLCTALCLASTAQASCSSSKLTRTGNEYAATISFAKLNLSSDYLQPAGTLLGSRIVAPTAHQLMGANARSILWSCDEADLGSIYFLVATNGDDRLAGYWEVGAADGLSHVYATWWEYIGLKQSMAGVDITRFWKKVPITSFERNNRKINIRLMDLPPLEASLYKISSLPPIIGSNSNACNRMGSSGLYDCQQPNSYLQLSGDANVGFDFAHDYVGEDSSLQHRFMSDNNGFAYGLHHTGPLTRTETCVARNATPLIQFPTMSALHLQQGESAQADFSVTIECSDQVHSGTDSGQTAIAFEISNNAYAVAQNLGLLQANGAVNYLLSDQYQSNSDLAQGVGIRLKNAISGKQILFTHPATGLGGGESLGWYPVLEGASRVGRLQSGYSSYLQNYTAILEALPGLNVTPGKIKATATVVVKVQ